MDDNFSPRVKGRKLHIAKKKALRLGHDFIGTEHLMLGLLRDGSGKAINILNALDIHQDPAGRPSKSHCHLERGCESEQATGRGEVGVLCGFGSEAWERIRQSRATLRGREAVQRSA